jgi:hypothetical protein
MVYYRKVLRDRKPSPEAEWVKKGFLAANECFNCANKVSHFSENHSVNILCMIPCNQAHS